MKYERKQEFCIHYLFQYYSFLLKYEINTYVIDKDLTNCKICILTIIPNIIFYMQMFPSVSIISNNLNIICNRSNLFNKQLDTD